MGYKHYLNLRFCKSLRVYSWGNPAKNCISQNFSILRYMPFFDCIYGHINCFLSSTLRGLYRGMGWSRWSMSWNSWKITGHGHLTFLLNYHSLNSGCRLRVDRSDHQNNSIISLLARQIQWKLDLAEKSVTVCLQKRDFPLFRADLCTKNQKWSLRFMSVL